VQENCIDLVGRIADRGAEFVSAKEWMRICFELLDMLKAHKKAIRRATVNTFGYIAKAIGPQDVLAVLLNNLKVQERQNRVCTTVAIAIVAETCGPFTVLPALMNEYRLPELNVQNGVLKALSFLFEYIGEMGKDYVYAVTPLLEDALMDRDLVHRQTSATVVKHLTLGVYGLGCEDALQHLLNFVWPNIFEQSPHVINAVMECIEAMRISLGPTRVLQHTLQGLWIRPAKCVRSTGKSTTTFTLAPRTGWYRHTLVSMMTTSTITAASSSSMCSRSRLLLHTCALGAVAAAHAALGAVAAARAALGAVAAAHASVCALSLLSGSRWPGPMQIPEAKGTPQQIGALVQAGCR